MREVAQFETALRAAVPTRPDPRLGAALVPRLAEAARVSTVEAEKVVGRPRRSRRALLARVGIAVALIPLVLAGLAFAGVTVPGAARSAFDSIGIKLPNQPAKHTKVSSGENSSGQSGGAVPGTTATGPAQSTGHSAAGHKNGREQRPKAGGKAIGDQRGKAIGHQRGKAIGHGGTPPGHTGQTGPPAHSNAGGSPASHGSHSAPKTHPTHVPQGNANGHSK